MSLWLCFSVVRDQRNKAAGKRPGGDGAGADRGSGRLHILFPSIPSTDRALPCGIHWPSEPHNASLSFQVDLGT